MESSVMILSELIPPERFELTQAVVTTFDLDLAVLKSFPGFVDDPGKFTVFRGEGEFIDLPASDPERESLLASVVTVPFPKGTDGRPSGYAHGKIALFDCVRDNAHLYRLLITSANISSYDNLGSYTVFSGRRTGMEQAGTLPLIDYLRILNPYAEGRLDALIERLREVRFEPLPEYACEAHSFIAVCPGKASGADLLSEPFDELLVISPFIHCQECLSLIAAANENARLVLLSQTPVIRRLVKDGLITEASGLPIRLHLIPQSKTQKYIHAKIYLRRTGKRWDLFTGSMNLTPFAMTSNLEFMVRRVNPQGIGSIEDYLTSFFSGSVSEEETPVLQRRIPLSAAERRPRSFAWRGCQKSSNGTNTQRSKRILLQSICSRPNVPSTSSICFTGMNPPPFLFAAAASGKAKQGRPMYSP